ncbi:MAG: hypothetical protein U0992_24285 [Planctomycetaceae bacterium]
MKSAPEPCRVLLRFKLRFIPVVDAQDHSDSAENLDPINSLYYIATAGDVEMHGQAQFIPEVQGSIDLVG